MNAGKVPRRMDCRVRMPDQISIWLSQDEATGAKWKWMCGFFTSHAFTSGDVRFHRQDHVTLEAHLPAAFVAYR